MLKQSSKPDGPPTVSEAKLPGLLRKVGFGTITLHVVDGAIASGLEPRVRYTRKPRSHRRSSTRDPTDKPQPSMAEAIRDLQEDISQLKGTWEVTIKVANSVPIKWDVEEVRPPRHSRSS